MTILSRTAIEYGHYAWPLVSGCDHGLKECAVADKCWARGAYRLHKYDFTPTLHPERLNVTMPRKPSRILVSFTGDAMAEKWQGNDEWATMIDHTLTIMEMHPEHSYLWLTKHPQGYSWFNHGWPANAWLGASITGAESAGEQDARIEALRLVEGGHKWVSLEPLMGPLSASLYDVSWLVIGGFSGRKELTLEQAEWGRAALWQADGLGIPVWLKRNCGYGYRRELPDASCPRGW